MNNNNDFIFKQNDDKKSILFIFMSVIFTRGKLNIPNKNFITISNFPILYELFKFTPWCNLFWLSFQLKLTIFILTFIASVLSKE